jgi:light-harvesting complex 1 alpha chain
MWRIWMLFDPRRALVVMGIFVFAIILTNHFVMLTSKYAFWLQGPGPGGQAVATVSHNAPLPAGVR